MTVKQRLAAALAANSFGQLVTIGSQLLLTPLYFSTWGAERYGEWLLLSGIPAYLAIADAGIGSAAGNEMTMRAGAGDRAGAQRTFRGALMLAYVAAAAAIALGMLLALILVSLRPFNLVTLGGTESASILVVLAAHVGLTFIGSVISNGFRCGERNATGISAANLVRVAEALVMGALLVAGASPLVVAIGATAVKALGLLIQWRLLSNLCNWLFESHVQADMGLLRRLARPALGFLAFPAGNALLLQGPLLIIGAALGGSAVALFATTRTIARLPLQLASMSNATMWPEMSRAFGAGDLSLLRRLHHASVGATAIACSLLALALLFLGADLMRLWIGSHFDYSRPLMAMLLVATLFSAVWGSSSVVLAATNNHGPFGLLFVIASAMFILSAMLLVRPFEILGVSACLIAFEFLVGVAVVRMAVQCTQESVRSFFVGSFRSPLELLQLVNQWRAPGKRR